MKDVVKMVAFCVCGKTCKAVWDRPPPLWCCVPERSGGEVCLKPRFAVCIGGFAVGNVTIEPVRHRADKLVWSEKDSDWTVADWIDDSKYVGDGLELRAMGAFVDANPGFQILVR